MNKINFLEKDSKPKIMKDDLKKDDNVDRSKNKKLEDLEELKSPKFE